MYGNLFAIDPMAASSYGLYNSVKKEEGSFLDFLLSYDSKGANESDNSWLSDLVGGDMSKITSVEVLQALASTEVNSMDILSQSNYFGTQSESIESLSFAGVSTMDFLSQKSYFDTQAEGYKLLLTNEMKKRDIEVPEDLGADIYSLL